MFGLKNKKSLWLGLFGAALVALGFLVAAPALAQVNTGIEFGGYTGLVNTDIRIIVAKIIRVALGLLGIVVLGYFLYGGYLYLTAGGNPDQVKSAKAIFKNAIIGLAIILSAFSITQFIITSLTNSIISDYCVQNPSECAPPIPPGGCIGPECAFPGTTFYSTVAPQGNLPIYNVVINVQFSGGFGSVFVNRSTINSDNIKIVKSLGGGSFDTNSYPGTFEFVNDSLVSFHPTGSCGDGIASNDCFEKNTTYKVILSTAIQSAGGANLDCSTHTCEALFTTGDKYDATPPTATMVLPGNWAIVGDNRNTTISADYSDDTGVKQVSFAFKNDKNAVTDITDILLNPYEAQGTREYNLWQPHLQDPEKAEVGELTAKTFDLDNHQTTSPAQQVKIVPAYCFNGVLDTAKNEQQVHSLPPENGPDCGKNSQCGACTGDFCDTNFDCAGTFCDQSTHTCVARPKILDVSPLQAGVGSLVSLIGSNFGVTAGKVLFNGVQADVVACPLTGNNPSWYNNAVIVKVPSGSVNGTLELRKSGYSGATDLANFDTTAAGDNWGNPASFTLTNDVLPGLSCVDPQSESPFNTIDIAGENLGSTKGSVKFSSLAVTGADIINWRSDGKRITATVPNMPAQTLSLGAVTVDNKISNYLPFTVKPVAENILPQIDDINPEKGSVGTYVTITGRNFGASGSVIFKLNANDTTGIAADLPPSSCGTVWNPTQIIIKVPNAIDLGGDSLRDYYIQVKTTIGDSNSFKFTVNKDPIRPGLCSLTPSSGPTNTEITLNGERFGAQKSAVEYWQSVTSTLATSWGDLKIVDKVPTNAKTGGVKVWSQGNGLYSNALNFKVQNCNDELKKGKPLSEVCLGNGEKCCGDGTCQTICPEETTTKSSMFAWSFTSGQFPIVPRIVEQCGKYCVGTNVSCSTNNDCKNQSDPIAQNCQFISPSPSPSLMWPNSNAVCVNAAVNVLFNTEISDNGVALSSNNASNVLEIYKCNDEACNLIDANQVVNGAYSLFTDNGGTGLNFAPTNDFDTTSTYEVIVTTNAKSTVSVLSANMPEDTNCPKIDSVSSGKKSAYCFRFKTSNTNALCKIGNVVVTPISYSTSTLNITKTNFYSATPLADGNACVGLVDTYDWRWNPSDDITKTNLTPSVFASISNKEVTENGVTRVRGTDQDLSIKLRETPTPLIVTSTWKGDPEHANFADKIFGRAYLNILPKKPRIADYYPRCNSACVNAAVGFEFDMPVKNPGSFVFAKCNNATCTSKTFPSVTFTYLEPQNIGGQILAKGIKLTTNLQKNSLYQVTIQSYAVGTSLFGARSITDAILDPLDRNSSSGFTWLFRTKDDDSACSVDSVEISPASATVNVIGDTAEYYSLPKGKADACSPNGQILQGGAYNWLWSSANTNVATISSLDRGQRPQGSTAVSAYCGDGIVNQNESCDNASTSCNINCDNVTEGTQACTDTNKVQCCGNGGAPEFNEQCDLGVLNGAPGSSCTANCLKKNVISLDYCLRKNTDITDLDPAKQRALRIADCESRWGAIAICGNSAVEDGEECDLGSANGTPGSTCSDKCLLTAKQFGTTGDNVCGNKITETINNEECDGQIGCGSDCRWSSIGDGKTDPDQYAKAVGLGVIDPATKQQTTQINAATLGKTGAANFILQCGFEPVNSSCPRADVDKGAGTDSCCHLRPQVLLDNIPSGTWPRPPYNSGICPNAKISVRFDQVMDEKSFTSSTPGYYNIILAEATSTPNCPTGTYRVGYKEIEPQSWWQKIKFAVRRFFGRPALADYYCAGGLDYDLQTITDTQTIGGSEASSTIVSLIFKKPLDSSKNYRLLATKDAADIYDVKMQDKWEMDFTTANQICKINNLLIDPSSYSFNRTGQNKNFTAKPTFINPAAIGAPAQELLSMPNIYDWNYSWVDGDLPPPDIIDVTPVAGTNEATVTALGKNGETSVGARVTITEDKSAGSTVGKVFSATSTISVFLCENPWPSANLALGLGLGYFDADGNINNILIGHGWSNFKLLYCRDAGAPNNTSDDLSALNLNTPIYHIGDNSGIFKEFFFTFDSPSNKNSIGLRVYPNTNHLSIVDWYNSQPWIPKGSPVPAKVGSDDHVYEALQEGRTYYINGLNTSGNSVYTNVYVFAFSDNPTSETLNVITQLLNNFTLNVNEVDNKPMIAALTRDFTRFKDLKTMSDKLAANYKSQGTFPKLTESTQYGTFLPAYTTSKWQSWQLLGNSLGYGMPNDPINQFYGCGSSTLFASNGDNLGPYDPETCWNAGSSTFVCPAGSHVYQYSTKGGVEAEVKADFEVGDGSNWVNPLNNLLDVKLCLQGKNICQSNTDCQAGDICAPIGVTFQLSGSCNSAVQGIGGRCGDGIVGPGEECEIGQTKQESCTSASGYQGVINYTCSSINCSWQPVPVKYCANNAGSWTETRCTTNADCKDSSFSSCSYSYTGTSERLLCSPQGKCGDGIKQSGEQCDDGANNGKYGYCAKNCTLPSPTTPSSLTAGFCGNFKLDVGNEVCDLSSASHPSPAQYNLQKNLSCSWDCQSYDYCGDGKVNSTYEECEKSESCQVGICQGGSQNNKYCESDADCQGEACVSYVPGKRYCKITSEKLSVDTFDTIKNKTLFSDSPTQNYAANLCVWDRDFIQYDPHQEFANQNVTCLPTEIPAATITPQSCGIDADKDGNYKDPGEECDFGPANGSIPPTPPGYNQTATYCTLGCTQATVSGPFCGDNILNGSEICDGTVAATGYNNRFCLKPDFTETKNSSNTPCDMSSCSSFVCPTGWRFCKDTTECPLINMSLTDSGSSKDDIFQVEIDGQLDSKYIIPAISGGNPPEYPANSSLNLISMPVGVHKIKVYNITGGQSGTGRITFDPAHVKDVTLLEKHSTAGYQNLWQKYSSLNIDPTDETGRGTNYVDFRITLPKQCGTYWDNWLKVFEPNPVDAATFETNYPCVEGKDDPGYILYQFTGY